MQLKMIYKQIQKSLLKKSLYYMICVLLNLSGLFSKDKCITHKTRRSCILSAHVRSLSNIDIFSINIYFYLVVFVTVFCCFVIQHGGGPSRKGHGHPHDPVRPGIGLWTVGLHTHGYARIPQIRVSFVLFCSARWFTFFLWTTCL